MKVVTFGEIMMRLMPPGYLRIVQADTFETTYAGGEANVAVSLSNYGLDASFVTKVPSHEVGQAAVNSLRKYGVNTQFIKRGGDRLGVYYVEKGASMRPSKVIYDRANSAFALSKCGEYDWNEILKDVAWFHFTGITPALSDSTAELSLEALKACKERGITVSCDLNYRNKLWSKEKAREVMTKLMPYVNVLIANEEDANDVFGIKPQNSDVTKGILNKEDYIDVAKQLKDTFGFKYVAITLRTSISANFNKWAGMLYDGNAYFSKEYGIDIVDRVGGGDSFGGGLIYSLISKYDCQKAIEFAVAASALKHTIQGDYNQCTVAEVTNLMNGNASGRVIR